MKKIITGFHQDENKEWVTSSEGRNIYIGFELECRLHAHAELDR